jgi:alpha-glucosidase
MLFNQNPSLIRFEFDNQKFSLNFKGKNILSHNSQRACIQLSHNIPDFRMHPRSVSNYKIKNHLSNHTPLIRISKIEQEQDSILIEFEELIRLEINVVHNRLELTFNPLDKIKQNPNFYNHFSFSMPALDDEAIYGCGEQFSYLNLRGRCVPLWTQEPGFAKNHSIYKYFGDLLMGAGGEWWTTYYPQAIFVSSRNYFVNVETYTYTELDFRNRNYHQLRINEIPKKIIIDVAESAPDLLNSLTSYLGRQRPLPSWIMDGVILGIGGGMDSSNEQSLPAKINRAKQKNTKIAAIWAEDWTGLREFKAQTRLFWNWKFSPTMYPNLPAYITQLKAEGIRFLGYNNCFLMYDSEIYEYAKDRGYLVKDKNGEPYSLTMFTFAAVMLDLSNPDCWNWIKSIIKDHMIGIGLDGWMCDFAEYLPIDGVVHSGTDPYLHHNEYPVLWAKVNAEAVHEMKRDSGQDAVIFFSRSGNFKTTQYSPLIWSGDQVMTFWLDSGLPAAINSAISMGFSGVGQIHADIAGEFGILWFKRTKELFMRWTEYGAFTPVMRTHEAKGHSGWTLDSDEETLAHFAKFSRIHAALLPYFEDAVKAYQESGLPIIRHPFIHYEEDTTFHLKKPRLLQYQYLLGRDIFVAPVIQKKSISRKLYLPNDQWIHLWSDREYSGGWVTIPAPIGEPPVFIRKASKFVDLFKMLKNV